MNICLLNDSFPPTVDGVANAVVNYANILSSRGNSVSVATPAYPGVTDNYPYPVIRYRSFNTEKLAGYRAGIPFDKAAIDKISSLHPELLHVHCPVMSATMARLVRKKCGAPVILTYHTKFDLEIARVLKGAAIKSAARDLLVRNISACDEVWVVSSGAGDNLRQLGYEGSYTVMPNGVDLPRGRVSEEKAAALRRACGIPANVPMLLFVGRMVWYKGIRTILDALALMRSSGLDFRMVFVGDGSDRAEIENYAKSLGISDKTVFSGIVRDRGKLREYFCGADMFLFPSLCDTNGLVVREAASCALPSILIRNSAASEGITDGDTGFLCENSAESLKNVLMRAVYNRELCRTVGKNAQDKLYISWEDAVKFAEARYAAVIDAHRTSPEKGIG